MVFLRKTSTVSSQRLTVGATGNDKKEIPQEQRRVTAHHLKLLKHSLIKTFFELQEETFLILLFTKEGEKYAFFERGRLR